MIFAIVLGMSILSCMLLGYDELWLQIAGWLIFTICNLIASNSYTKLLDRIETLEKKLKEKGGE